MCGGVGALSGGSLSRGYLYGGVSVQGGLCLGVSVYRVPTFSD